MIVLIRSGAAGQVAVLGASVSQDCSVRLLLENATGGTWDDAAHTATDTLGKWLTRLAARPPDPTRLLVCANSPEECAPLVAQLREILGSAKVECAAVLFGPLLTGADFSQLLAVTKTREGKSCPFIDSVVYLGNEDQHYAPVDAGRRARFVQEFFQLLAEGGVEAARAIRLFEPGRKPFQSVGLNSLGRQMEPVKLAVYSLLLDELREEFAAEMKRDTASGSELEKKAEASLERCKALDLAWDRATKPVQGSWESIASQMPRPFNGWRCPLSRGRFLAKGERTLKENFRGIREIREKLKGAVEESVGVIRGQGQVAFAEEQREKILWIKQRPSLGRLAAILARHLPRYEELARQRAPEAKRPCSPLSDPDEAACRTAFVEQPSEVMRDKSRMIPSSAGWIGFAAAEMLLAVLAWAGIRYPAIVDGPWWGLGGMLALGLGVLGWTWCARKRAVKALNECVESQNAWLLDAMDAKRRWFLEKARLTLGIQIVAFNRRIARRLNRALGLLFNRWEEMLRQLAAEAAAETGDKPDFGRLGLTPHLEEIKRAIGDLGATVADHTTGDGCIEVAVPRRFESLVHLAYRRSLGEPVGQTDTEAELLTMVEDRGQPPLLARIGGGVLLRGIFKAIVLPETYSSDLEEQLRRKENPHASDKLIYFRAPVTGPAVWVSRRDLDEQEVRESLKVNAIGTR